MIPFIEKIEKHLNCSFCVGKRISSGHNADTFLLCSDDGIQMVAKTSAVPVLDTEARMLRYLEEHSVLPAPKVLYHDPHTLVMANIPDDNDRSPSVERDAAEHLAALHSIENDSFGFDFDTVIGSLAQPNPKIKDWTEFYRDHRLLHYGRLAYEAGTIGADTMKALEHFCGAPIETILSHTPSPQLIHGDIWGGNVRTYEGKISGFIDPGLYFADAEIELAFITMFHTFGQDFFDHYHSLKPIAPEFWNARKDVYLLYPLLVHCTLYGSSYENRVKQILGRFV